MPIDADRRAVERRALGRERNGQVFVRDFDRGIIETMGATIRLQEKANYGYFIDIPGVEPPPGMPGIPIVFTLPEDMFEQIRMPWIMITRDEVATAIQRWHPGTMKYRVPREGAVETYLEGNVGFDGYEEQPMSEPADITYSITLAATRRSGLASNALEKLWYFVRKVYKPYGLVIVKDSVGDLRTYNAFREGEFDATDVIEVGSRVASLGISVRIEGELDIEDPVLSRAVSRRLTPRFRSL